MTTPAPPADRIEPIGIEVEMQRSYLDYAMSVIVGRALPDVRDGLKPVHRRVLYAMYDSGYRPDRGYVKCSRVIGDVMGNYHPHGDSSIYDALVRLAQSWSLRYPLVDGNGNFGSPGNDPAAAMRYCVTGDTLVRLADGSHAPITSIVPDAQPSSEHEIEVKLADRHGNPVLASRFFHSGAHPTLRLTTTEGYALTGSHNHPVLTLSAPAGVPMLLWKLLDEIRPDDRVVLQRTSSPVTPVVAVKDWQEAVLLGAWVSEGHTSVTRAGFNNLDRDYFDVVLTAYDAVVGGQRYLSSRVIASGNLLHEIDIHNTSELQASPLAQILGQRSADKTVPGSVWAAGTTYQRAFLQSLFEGDGSVSLLDRSSIQISYSTRSERLAEGVQQLLLGFGVVSRVARHATGELKVYVSNRRDARLFARRIGFLGRKQQLLEGYLGQVPQTSSAMSSDHVPFVADYLRAEGAHRWTENDWLRRHNVDRVERWECDRAAIQANVTNTEAFRVVEPLMDAGLYYAKVLAVEDAGVQDVYSVRVDSDDHAFVTNGFVSHNTEAKLAPLAMEMLRDINEETVDFIPNYDSRTQEPVVLPSRIPNLIVNGSAGIAVGMATNIPPHNLREINDGIQWMLANPAADEETTMDALLERVKGPDFPTGAMIVGLEGIKDAYRTGRGSVRMRSVVEVDEHAGRTRLVITELPYQVNPDNLALKIAELVREGSLAGIADIQDLTSARSGQRLVIVLKRDAVAKVVLNNLYKQTQLQDSFGCNMLAIVDGVPRTLRLDQILQYWITHQLDVVVRRARYRLRKAEERAHILEGYIIALDNLDEVIALIRASASSDAARGELMTRFGMSELQAVAVLDMQLRRLAALERQRILDEFAELQTTIADLKDFLASPERQRSLVGTELAEVTEKYGDVRRTVIRPFEGEMRMEDLIAQEDVVVTVTRGGYAKRTKVDLYRAQRRGGKGVQGAALREDDLVEHFFVTTTHHWLLFFTNKGRVYRCKAHELPEQNRAAKGQHVANILAFQPDETIAQVIDLRDYDVAPYLVLATRRGLVKKTALADFDSNRTGGVVGINLREDDEVIGARLVRSEDDLLLISARAQSIRFTADDDQLRPMGRATSGVIGMRFSHADDVLLAMLVVGGDEQTILTATEGGFFKRTKLEEYNAQKRGGTGVLTHKVVSTRGRLIGALAVGNGDQIFAITSNGGVIRTTISAKDPRPAGRQTMGVKLMNLPDGVTLVTVTLNADSTDDQDELPGTTPTPAV